MRGLISTAAIVLALSASQAQAATAQPPLPYGTPITLEQAKRVAAAANAQAARMNLRVTVVIVEPTGELVYAEKADGAQYAAIDLATKKAVSAARFRRPSLVFMQQVQSGNSLPLAIPGAFPFGGGVPIVVDGRIIGAIGETGGPDDGAIAQAGADALK